MSNKLKMVPEIKELFLLKLRSGEYEQGKNTFKDKDGKFCVVGVYIDLYLKAHNMTWEDLDNETCADFINKKITPWGNFDCADVDLYHLNDNGNNFLELADFIEKNR